MITLLTTLLAQRSIKPPTPNFIDTDNPAEAIGIIMSLAFKVLLIVAALYAAFQIIMAGYSMISSGGDKAALESARGKIIWSFVGIIIIAASWGFVMLIEGLLGICLGFSCAVDFSL